ncbi:hypothetical protein ACX9R5_06510 [Rathayibacter sp. CAU 1779]
MSNETPNSPLGNEEPLSSDVDRGDDETADAASPDLEHLADEHADIADDEHIDGSERSESVGHPDDYDDRQDLGDEDTAAHEPVSASDHVNATAAEQSPAFDEGEASSETAASPEATAAAPVDNGADAAAATGSDGVDAPDAVVGDEPHRIDEIPTDIGEPEPALEAPESSSDAITETEGDREQILPPEPSGPVPAEAEAATVAAGGAVAGQAVAPGPVYVTSPTPPKAKGNRLMGILIAVVAAIAYAVVFAAVSLGVFALRGTNVAMSLWERYLQTAGFWTPVVVFFLAFVLLIVIVNRGRWWAYILGSFFVGVIVYFGYLGGALLTVQAWKLTPEGASQFIGTLWINPLTFASAVVAREAALWFGGWVSIRGRRVREANLEARRQHEERLAAGPTVGSSA